MWAPAQSSVTPGMSSISPVISVSSSLQRARRVQPLDEVLDVGLGVLRVHEPRHRVLHLAPVEDDRRRHREAVVLAAVVDVHVGVADVADVADAHAVARELVLDHVLVELEAAHAERLHDRVVAVAGVDHDRVLPAEDQEAVDGHAAGAAAVAAEHEEARFELDVAVVEQLDFQGHLLCLLPLTIARPTAGRPGWRCRERSRSARSCSCRPSPPRRRRPAPDRSSTASRSGSSSRTGSASRRRSPPSPRPST